VIEITGRNCYVVSYDIMDQRRLQKVHKTMKGFGEAIHYSVFRCDLTGKGRVEMVAALTDRIMILDLGPTDGRVDQRIEFLGIHAKDPDSPRRAVII
jgi:CRISPR-associated protein Cas2